MQYARKLAAGGLDLILTGRRGELLRQRAAELRGDFGVSVELLVGDLNDPSILGELERRIHTTPSLSVLVSNAGYGRGRAFVDDAVEDQAGLLKIHTEVPVRLSHAALSTMHENKTVGAIVLVSSLASYTPVPRGSVYAAAKAFLRLLAEGLHLESIDSGIAVQALLPGLTRSDFHRDGKLDVPRDRRFALIAWQDPEKVVNVSLRMLGKRVLVVPGLRNRMIRAIGVLLPRRLLYSALRRARS